MKNFYIASLIFTLVLLSSISITAQPDRGAGNKATTEKRLALVIGNGAYKNTATLRTANNDAADMTAALTNFGFEVMSGTDQTKQQMTLLIQQFSDKLAQQGGVGLFFYAGHGVRANGVISLIPVDAKINEEKDIEIGGINLDFLLNKVGSAKKSQNIVILDTSLNNPFTGNITVDVAPKPPPPGTLIAYPTAFGRTSTDGSGRNGLYTEELLRQMKTPDRPIDEILKDVSSEVGKKSKNRQVPWVSGSIGKDLYLGKSTTAANISTPVKPVPVVINEPKTVAQLPGRDKRWALVIGVDNYTDSNIPDLGGAANDAKALAEALEKYAGFPADQIILLATSEPPERQPTRTNILKRLSNLKGLVPKDGLFLVSFAGHGIERENKAFLIPSDATSTDDVSLLEDTALSVNKIKDQIKASGVRQVLFLLDACRNDPNGGRADSINPLSEAYKRGFSFDVANQEVEAFATIYATSVGERAFEYAEKKQGYFSWAIVEGLSGKAANVNGQITLGSLVKFVSDQVPKRVAIDMGSGKKQKPFAQIEGYKADELVLSIGGTAKPNP